MAVTALDNIQLRLPGFYDKYDENSVLYGIISSFADVDKSRDNLIDRVNDAIGIDTIHDEDLQHRFGSLLSMNKKSDESYTAYRNRLKMAYPSLVGGTANAIRYAIASAIGITDDQRLIDDYIKVYDAWEEYDGPDVVRTGTNIQINQSISSYADITKIEGASYQAVTVQGKNLFHKFLTSRTASGVTLTVGSDGTITLNGTATDTSILVLYAIPVSILFNGTYTLSVNNPVVADVKVRLNKTSDGITDILDEVWCNSVNAKKTITLNNAYVVNFAIRIGAGTTLTNYTVKPQLELGSTATAYAPFIHNSPSPLYPSPIITPSNFNLTASNGIDSNSLTIAQSMRALPNGVKDEIVKANGVTKHIKRVGKVVFDGSIDEVWVLNTYWEMPNTVAFYCASVPDKTYAVADIFSDLFKTKYANGIDEECICGESGSYAIYIRILKSRLLSLDAIGIKTWLASNITTAYYQLATPIETIMPDLTLTSYKGTTSIISMSNPQVNITVAFKDAIYTVIHNTPNEYKTYCNILCIIDLTVGQNASDMEQEIIDAINIVKASGISPHILYIGIKIMSYSDMSRFNYVSLGGLSYAELSN